LFTNKFPQCDRPSLAAAYNSEKSTVYLYHLSDLCCTQAVCLLHAEEVGQRMQDALCLLVRSTIKWMVKLNDNVKNKCMGL
jgi:hypothetical protein